MSEGLIGVIIGGVITFLIGYFTESRKQKSENIKFKKEKIEKLYIEYLNWFKANNSLYTLFLHFLESGKDLQTSIDLLASKAKEHKLIEKSNENNVVFLINLYFTELSVQFKEIEYLSNQMTNSFIREFSASFNLKSFKKSYSQFLEHTSKLEKDILEISSKIGRC